MYIVSYGTQGAWRAGIAAGSLLAEVETLYTSYSPDTVSTVRALLEGGKSAVDQAIGLAKRAFDSESENLISLEGVELGPPVPDPCKIICLGLNYPEHAREVNIGAAEVPTFFAKFRNALCGPYSDIVMPRVSAEVDYEGELTVVIGRRCKDVSEQEAMRCVAGYTIMNDVSARDLQFQTGQWTAGKTLDTFAPTGPGIVPASSIPDPQALEIITRVNGVTLQHGNTRDMIFPVSRTIAFLSSLMTLEPGDLIAMGTPSGVGFKRQPPLFLKNGDVVEVEIDRIGLIRNTVVAPGK
jgi:2-keto-4-pentenoate hydratase/2-oxohepta-3-ene-1,7-dioic acid hydratase in catechol pathway